MVACEPYTFQSRRVLPAPWHGRTPVELFFSIEDAAQPYQLFVTLQSTVHYPFHNVYLESTLYEAAHCTVLTKERGEYLLYDPIDGSPIGSKSGNIVHHEVILPNMQSFSKEGVYILSLTHHMREEFLPHIISVGVRGIKENR